MTTFIDHQKAFISLFNRTAPYHKRHKVFEDVSVNGAPY